MWERDFENWRDSIHCGGEEPVERISAIVGQRYERYDYINREVVETVICTIENRAKIERALNDTENDMWTYRLAR